jgi:hypothetical protein
MINVFVIITSKLCNIPQYIDENKTRFQHSEARISCSAPHLRTPTSLYSKSNFHLSIIGVRIYKQFSSIGNANFFGKKQIQLSVVPINSKSLNREFFSGEKNTHQFLQKKN